MSVVNLPGLTTLIPAVISSEKNKCTCYSPDRLANNSGFRYSPDIASVYLQHTCPCPKSLIMVNIQCVLYLPTQTPVLVAGPAQIVCQTSSQQSPLRWVIGLWYGIVCQRLTSHQTQYRSFQRRVQASAYIIVTFRVGVRVMVSVWLRCHLANKVSVRCVYRSSEQRDRNYLGHNKCGAGGSAGRIAIGQF